MDITNIPIALITEQYLDYLKLMKVLNLDVAGEYLLMASTLLHIKSKMLLPAPAEEIEEEEDPRAELIRKLMEYQKYKEAALSLEQRPLLDRDVFIRMLPTPTDLPPEDETIEVSLFELLEAFREMLKRVKPGVFHEVTLDRLTVEEKIQEILLLLQKENRSMSFHLLFSEQASRREMIITFLAILELVKMKIVRIFQPALFETIRISPV
jgi:segregation and condensation protein A